VLLILQVLPAASRIAVGNSNCHLSFSNGNAIRKNAAKTRWSVFCKPLELSHLRDMKYFLGERKPPKSNCSFLHRRRHFNQIEYVKIDELSRIMQRETTDEHR
jgi:hypothetical protein